MRCTPITNPTSTVLFKSIVAREDPQRDRLPAVGARRPVRRAGGGDTPGGGRAGGAAARSAAGDPRPHARRLPVPVPPPRRRLHLDHRRPQGRRRGERRRASRASASAPATPRSTSTAAPTCRMAVVDMLISKTFDASVICPAEQTCVDRRGDLGRDRRRARAHGRAGCSAGGGRRDSPTSPFRAGRSASSCARSASRASTSATMAGFEAADDDKVLLAPLPPDLDELARHPLLQEKLMPVLGLVRSPSVEHALAVCELVTEHGGLGHTSAVYATRRGRDRSASPRRSGPAASSSTRRLPWARSAASTTRLTPTFSLGCGTWGGSITTDNVNYRNLLNIKTVSRRQAPPQWFRVPSDTYFNVGAIDSLRQLGARPGDARDRPRRRGARRRRRGARAPRRRGRARVLRRRARAWRGADPRGREGARRAAARTC